MNNLELHSRIEEFIKNKFPDNFDKSILKLENAIYNMSINKSELDDRCYFNNDSCSNAGMAIGSHLLQQNGVLSKLSKNKNVVMFRRDFSKPYRYIYKPVNIDDASKFLGFCQFHDKHVFAPIENDNSSSSIEEKMFLYTLRSFANEHYNQHRNLAINKAKLELSDSEEVEKYIGILKADKSEYIGQIKECIDELEDILLEYEKIKTKLIDCYMNRTFDEIKYTRVKSAKKGIAFSSTITIPSESGKEVMFSVTILPEVDGSEVIFSYFKSDGEYIKSDDDINNLLQGKFHPFLNALILASKENLYYSFEEFQKIDISSLNAFLYENDFRYVYLPPRVIE